MPIRIKVPKEYKNKNKRLIKRLITFACFCSFALVSITAIVLWGIKLFSPPQPNTAMIGQPIIEEEIEEPLPEPKEEITSSAKPKQPPIKITIAEAPSDINFEPTEFNNPDGGLFGGTGGDGIGGFAPDGDGTGPAKGMGSNKKMSSSFRGRFWDLKRMPSGKASPYAAANGNVEVLKLLSRFYNNNWQEQMFSRYYESPQKLYTPFFFMPLSLDSEACAAYDPHKRYGLKPNRWVAIYSARVQAPESGRFRFIGIGDSVMAVRFNKKNVLSCGLHTLEDGKWYGSESASYREGKEFFQYEACSKWSEDQAGMAGFQAGEPFDVKAGEWYEMEVLVSEIGSINFGFCLLIDEISSEIRPTNELGERLFQLFRTQLVSPTAKELYDNMSESYKDDERIDIPYEEESRVWFARPLD